MNFKKLDDPSFDYGDTNPTCGDEAHLYVKFDSDEKVMDIGWQGTGCTISKAAASLLTDEILERKMSLEEMKDLSNDDMIELLGVPITPPRFKCAILALKVLEGGIVRYEGGDVGQSVKFRDS